VNCSPCSSNQLRAGRLASAQPAGQCMTSRSWSELAAVQVEFGLPEPRLGEVLL
jgi:hypothetical protein